MSKTVRALSLAVTAALLLPGCQALPTPLAPTTLRPKVTTPAAAKAGSVKVSFPGLAPKPGVFRTLATRADIDSVELVLTSRSGSQHRTLSRKALWAPMVTVEFSRVPAGPVQLEVTAYDASGVRIGEGSEQQVVEPNRQTMMNLAVQLAPETPSGDVGVTIDFLDGEPVKPCGAEAFHTADRNGDGVLDRAEFRGGYPFVIDCGATPEAMPAVVSPHLGVPATRASSPSPAATTAWCALPPFPIPPADAGFDAMDLDRDDVLTLEEFLGVAPPPSDPCEDAFHTLDANANGVLTFEEWAVGRPVPMIAMVGPLQGRPEFQPDWLRAEFAALDGDRDGVLSLNEHCGGLVPVHPMEIKRLH